MKTRTGSLIRRGLPAAVAGLMLWGLGAASICEAKPGAIAAPGAAQSSPTLGASAAAANNPEDIRDIRPPFHIPNRWLWPVWSSVAVLAALGAYGAWKWRRRSCRRKERLPFEIALEELEATRRLMQPDRARVFSIAVSEIVRGYIEQRFAVRAQRLTTWEFLQDVAARADSSLAGYRPLLGNFLYHCDLAKFARWLLSIPEMEAMLQSACQFVRETGRQTEIQEHSPAQTVERPTLPATGKLRPDAPASNSSADQPLAGPACLPGKGSCP